MDKRLREMRGQSLPAPPPKLMKLDRLQLVDELMRRRPELTDRKLLSHFTKAKLARMVDAVPARKKPVLPADGLGRVA